MDRRRVWGWALGAGAVASVACSALPQGAADGVRGVLGLLAVGAVVVGARTWSPERRGPWHRCAAGVAALLASEVVRSVHAGLAGVERPFPSPADAFVLGGYLFLVAGVLAFIRAGAPGRDRTELVDVLAVAVAAGVVAWGYGVAPAATAAGHPLERALVVAYLLLDVVLLGVTVRIAFGAKERGPSFWLLVAAVVLLGAGDVWWTVVDGAGAVQSRPAAAIYTLAVMTFAAAALHPSMARLGDRAERSGPPLPWRRLGLLTVTTLVAPAVLVARAGRFRPLDVVVVAVGSAVAFLLVVARTALLARAHERTAARSRALSEDLARQRAELALARTEARFRSLVQHAADVVAVMDDATMLRYVTPAVARVLGHSPEELTGARALDLVHPEDVAPALRHLGRAAGGAGPVDQEVRLRHRDGGWRTVDVTVTDLRHEPSVGGWVLNAHDVTERKALEEELRHLALHDPLTGLANRALFADRVTHALSRRSDRPDVVAVAFVDLDDFKTVNDSLGHAAGDALLAAVAERLRGCVRAADTVARLGGDEFALLLEDAYDRAEVEAVAERVLEALRAPVALSGHEVCVGASVGIAVDPARAATAEVVLRNADVAMYLAKTKGKGCYALFEEAMHAEVCARLELKADLARALREDEFRLHYQPIFDLATGAVSGVEALVRWAHPQRGLLGPGAFVGLAEETGDVVAIGQWVLDEACRQVQRWRDERRPPATAGPALALSVNLSVRQLRDDGLAAGVARALAASGLDPGALTLEITEGALMADTEATRQRLAELKALGVNLAVDDFGTGYSSLSYLQRFPIDVLKIDKSFVDGLGQRSGDPSFVRAIVDLARALRVRTVAEGIEEAEQLAELVDARCQYGQGYHFARPLPPTELEALLAGAPPRHRA